ncbi:MAG: hypothetical protein AAFW69_04110, partial [Pseudomonadota bacterium]
MTIVTAMIVIIAIATLAQRGDTLMAVFGAGANIRPADDSFSARAGRVQRLDVLSNDRNLPEGDDPLQILIVDPPACGVARPIDGIIEYESAEDCTGRLRFTYCLVEGSLCPSAAVTLAVLPIDGPPEVDTDGSGSLVAAPAAEVAPALPRITAEDLEPSREVVPTEPVAPTELAAATEPVSNLPARPSQETAPVILAPGFSDIGLEGTAPAVPATPPPPTLATPPVVAGIDADPVSPRVAARVAEPAPAGRVPRPLNATPDPDPQPDPVTAGLDAGAPSLPSLPGATDEAPALQL